MTGFEGIISNGQFIKEVWLISSSKNIPPEGQKLVMEFSVKVNRKFFSSQ